ncbi:hypothetical protein PBCV1_a108R [Paramecium bursaria Chlorella virus 1]|uniref:Uncharacterized protein n=1 Tax=Paramecium bursaria Chlorella virus 1 TaxID=10506 RepID=Q84429_PBCV1|nr:hypothetical protein PBCV1_a108R [Paramecium bursaria Chlorella virus 1]AAC96476.1 hypothetical protein [Paramecium bursaria Chlorella virus 1]
MKLARKVHTHGDRSNFLPSRKINLITMEFSNFYGSIVNDMRDSDVNSLANLSCNIFNFVYDQVGLICQRSF